MNNRKGKLYNLFTTCIVTLMLILNITGCNSNSKEQLETPTTTNTANNTEVQTQQTPPASPSSENTEAWRQFLKDYEEWTDSYVEFMKKYKANPSDMNLISEYGKFVAETAEWADKAQTYEDDLKQDNVSSEIITEYMNTLARITQKIAGVAY